MRIYKAIAITFFVLAILAGCNKSPSNTTQGDSEKVDQIKLVVRNNSTDSESAQPKENNLQAAKKESAELQTLVTPYAEKDGFIAQYNDKYHMHAINLSLQLAPELRNILQPKKTLETTSEFKKRSNYLAIDGKPIDMNAEYGLVLLDGHIFDDAMKGVRVEYNADNENLNIITSDEFCNDPAKDAYPKIPTGKEYGLTCRFNKITTIVFSSKQTSFTKYFKRGEVLKSYISLKDAFKISREEMPKLPIASHSNDIFFVGVMLVGRINKNLSIYNFEELTRYPKDSAPALPFTVTKIVYFNAYTGEILSSRTIK